MKKLTKALLWLALPLLAIGAVLMAAGWGMGGAKMVWSRFSDRAAHEETRPVEAVEQIEVNLSLGSVTFQPGDRYAVDLKWSGERYEMDYSCEDGLLRVWDMADGWMNLTGGEVVITLPENAKLDKVTVNAAAGSVDLAGFEAQTLTVDADLGSVTVAGVKAGEMDLTLDSGGLTLERASAEELDAELSLGSVEATALTVEESTEIRCDCGSVELRGILRGETEIQASLGSITVETALPEREYGYDLNADLGSVTVNGREQGSRAQKDAPGGKHFITAYADLGSVDVRFR